MTGQILVKFIRKGHGKLVGAVVATGTNQIGWAICHPSDRWAGHFDKEKAVEIAIGRSLKVSNPEKMLVEDKIPISARKDYQKMINRAMNFKGF